MCCDGKEPTDEQDADPYAGLTFRPEVAEYLRRFLKERPPTTPLDDVLDEMGIDLDD